MRREHAKHARVARREQPPTTSGARGFAARVFREAAYLPPPESGAFGRVGADFRTQRHRRATFPGEPTDASV